jgi:hypothetical protein
MSSRSLTYEGCRWGSGCQFFLPHSPDLKEVVVVVLPFMRMAKAAGSLDSVWRGRA